MEVVLRLSPALRRTWFAARGAARWGLRAALCAGLGWSVQAQTVSPDAGSIQRDIERQLPTRPPPVPSRPLVVPEQAPKPDELQFQIKGFVLQGVTLVPLEEAQSVLKPWLGRPIQFSDLDQAKQAIVDLYQRKGWFARPLIPEQELQDDSELRIEVIEGKLGAVRIEGKATTPEAERRIDPERVLRTFTARQQAGAPLYMPHIERATSLLNDLPGTSVNVTLASGEDPEATDVVVSLQPRDLVTATVSRDNTGSRSTGAVKDTVAMNLDSPYGWGDQTSLNLMRSKGVEYGRLAYTLPVGYDGWRVGVNASAMNYHVIFPMSDSNPSYPRGVAYTQGMSLSSALLRSAQHNLNLQIAYDQKHFVNEIFNPDTAFINSLSDKRVGVSSLSLTGDHSDDWMEGGVTQWSVGALGGRVDLSANTQNFQQDQQGPQTQGVYNKLNLSLSRLQRLSTTQSLWLSLQRQMANRNLDSSEKFTLGGSQGVRAYPSAEGTGDHGWLFTMESRQVVSPQWQWVAFIDYGQIRVNHENYVGYNGPDNVDLKGAGLSASYSVPGVAVARLTWSRRMGENPLANAKTGLDTDGSFIKHRLWLTVSGFF